MNSKLKYLEDNKTEYDFLRSMGFNRLKCYELIVNLNRLKKDLSNYKNMPLTKVKKTLKKAIKEESRAVNIMTKSLVGVFKNNERIL